MQRRSYNRKQSGMFLWFTVYIYQADEITQTPTELKGTHRVRTLQPKKTTLGLID